MHLPVETSYEILPDKRRIVQTRPLLVTKHNGHRLGEQNCGMFSSFYPL